MTKQTTTYKKPLKGEKADLLEAIRQDANRCHEFYDLANPHGISCLLYTSPSPRD